MRVAVIDCGTNTFNLVIVELESKGSYKKLFKTRVPVKLGEGAINQGFIAALSFTRGLEALRLFHHTIRDYFVDEVLAFATSAIRDASNGPDFIGQAESDFGFRISVIDGHREAELIYLGIRQAVKMSDEVSLVIDIGGGSTEFILADKERILWKESFRVGAARLLEKFTPSDPISSEEVAAIHNYLRKELQPLFDAAKLYPPTELVGSSGAFDSLVEMIHGEMDGEALTDNRTEYEIALSSYTRVADLVKSSTLEQRRGIKGLVPMRVDMIVISCVIVDFVLQSFDPARLRVSTYSLKEGALAEFIAQQQRKH